MELYRSLYFHLTASVRSLTLNNGHLCAVISTKSMHWFRRVRNNFKYLRNYWTDGDRENTKIKFIATCSQGFGVGLWALGFSGALVGLSWQPFNDIFMGVCGDV